MTLHTPYTEILGQQTVGIIHSWARASRAVLDRAGRMHRTTLEQVAGALDTGAYLARVGLGLTYSFTSLFNHGIDQQLEDGFELVRWPVAA